METIRPIDASETTVCSFLDACQSPAVVCHDVAHFHQNLRGQRAACKPRTHELEARVADITANLHCAVALTWTEIGSFDLAVYPKSFRIMSLRIVVRNLWNFPGCLPPLLPSSSKVSWP